MGRPLNKKYFNPKPTGNVGDGVASYTITNAGTYTAKPTVTVSAPALPGGVSATLGTVSMKALSATVATSGTGDATASYIPGDVLTLAGTTGTAATFDVATTLVRTFAVNAGGTTVWTTGDTVTFGPGSGWDVAAVITLTAAAGAITGFTVSAAGTYSGASDLQAVSPTSTSVQDGGGYQNDATFNLGMGVSTVTLASAGDMTVIPANPAATTTDSAAGTGAALTVSYGVLAVPVTASGSGYTSSADAALTFAPASTTAATAVLLATATNVILAHARVVGSANVLDADIAKQVSTNDYVMSTTDGTSKVALTTTDTPPAGGAYIVATDANGSTYWVTKLTAHRATLVRRSLNGSYLHPNGGTAVWSFAAAAGLKVQIENI